MLGQSFNFLMARGADAEALAKIEAAFEGKSDGGSEIRYRRKDGSEFWAGLFISPVRERAAMSSSISPRSSISPGTRRSKPSPGC